MILSTWGKDSNPYYQALQAMFAVGAFVSPLVAEQFVGEHRELDTLLTLNTSHAVGEFTNLSSSSVATGNASLVGHPSYQVLAESRIYIPFTICGVSTLLMAVPLCIFRIKKGLSRSGLNKEPSMPKKNVMSVEKSIKENRNTIGKDEIVAGLDVHVHAQKDSGFLWFIAVGEAGAFEFCAIAYEDIFIGFVATFAVTFLDWSAAEGALVSSVFWGSYLVSRILAVPISKCVSPVKMLGGLLFILSASAIALFVGMAKHDLVLWVCAGSIGITLGPMCPTVDLGLNHYVKVGGRTASLLLFFRGMGGVTLSAIIGQFLQNNQPIAFPSFFVTATGTMVMLYLVKLFLYSRFRDNRH